MNEDLQARLIQALTEGQAAAAADRAAPDDGHEPAVAFARFLGEQLGHNH